MFYPLLWLLRRIIKWSYDKYLLQNYDGIRLCDIASTRDEQSELFGTRIVQALDLVKTHDTRRFHRLKKHFRYIANRRMLAEASYDRYLHICDLDHSRFRFDEDEELGILHLAAALIHEATHGVVSSHKIPDDKKHRLRIERLCHQEEVRFAQRIAPETDFGAFDEAAYRTYYETSRWQLALNFIKHIREPKEPSG